MLLTDSYLGIPVEPGGRTREAVDCWGLVLLIYAEQHGTNLPTHDEVNWKDNDPAEVAATVKADALAQWAEVAAPDRREYDVVVLLVKGVPWHVGVVMDRNRFIHADPVRGVCIERFEAIHWKNRIVSFHRLKEADSVAIAPAA